MSSNHHRLWGDAKYFSVCVANDAGLWELATAIIFLKKGCFSSEFLHKTSFKWGKTAPEFGTHITSCKGVAQSLVCRQIEAHSPLVSATKCRPTEQLINCIYKQIQFYFHTHPPSLHTVANFPLFVIFSKVFHISMDLLEQVENRLQLICSICHILRSKLGHNKLICMGVDTPRHRWNMIWFVSTEMGRIHEHPQLQRFCSARAPERSMWCRKASAQMALSPAKYRKSGRILS